MYTIILILAIIASVLLILIVLIQNPKGGGLSSNFSAANQIIGVKNTNEGLEKLTWIFAGALLLCALIAPFFVEKGGNLQDSRMKDLIENAEGTQAPTNNSATDPGKTK